MDRDISNSDSCLITLRLSAADIKVTHMDHVIGRNSHCHMIWPGVDVLLYVLTQPGHEVIFCFMLNSPQLLVNTKILKNKDFYPA